MIRAHKIQLKPNFTQEAYFKQACGTARFVYNWALEQWNKQYIAGGKPSGMALKKQFNQIKKEQFPWVDEVHRDANAQPFANLQSAFVKFFKKEADHPAFKKKGKSKDSFYMANDKFRLDGEWIKVPCLGWVKMTEPLRFDGKIKSAVISRTADRWFVSVQVDMDKAETKPKTGINEVGIDLGVRMSVTLSNGTVYQSTKPLRKKLKRLKHLSREHSRKVKGSKNRKKAADKLAKLHWRIANVRRDFLQKTTTSICRESQAVCIETLSVASMIHKDPGAKYVMDEGFGEFAGMMSYKAIPYQVDLRKADRWYKSSKLCSSCGALNLDLKRSDKVFSCGSCGFVVDRDLNAALNLESLITSTGG